jgi:hypothetical protein
MNLSPDYYAALTRTQRHHQAKQGKTFSGSFTWKQRRRIKGLIDRFEATSMLDYGCGWGKQYQERDENTGQSLADFWGFDPVKFDPGVPHFQAEPKGSFDLVICVQVLGSIPTADLPAIVDRLYGHATKAIFVAERIGGVRKPIFEDMEAAMPHGFRWNGGSRCWRGQEVRCGWLPRSTMPTKRRVGLGGGSKNRRDRADAGAQDTGMRAGGRWEDNPGKGPRTENRRVSL